jgi:phage tail-like protein
VADPKSMRSKVYTSFFKTDMSKHCIAISPITARFPKVPASDSRHYDYRRYQPGQPIYGNITFEIIDHDDSRKECKAWMKDCYDGKDARKDLTIELWNQAGDTVRTFNLIDTFPTSLDYVDVGSGGGAGTVGKIRLEVRVNRIEMA